MAFEGYIDFVDGRQIRGWICDDTWLDKSLAVEICSGESVIDTIIAETYRADLQACGKGNGRHGFSFTSTKPPTTGPLRARVAGKRWFIPIGGPQQLNFPPRFIRGLAHSFDFGLPTVTAGFIDCDTGADVTELVERLMSAFYRSVENSPIDDGSEKADVWSTLQSECHAQVSQLLQQRDVAGLGRYLCDAHAQGITHGITQGQAVTPIMKSQPGVQQLEVLRCQDYLVSLAEFLAVLDVESPEQHGQWGENIHESPDHLVRLISDRVGIPIVPPQVIGSLFGIRTESGILSGRDLLSLYAALRLRDIAGAAHSLAETSVCEIGAGLGGCAYYANRLGIGRYSIFDLPIVNLLQGFYLIRALPKAAIRLYGEPAAEGAAVNILPWWTFGSPDSTGDYLFNADSFPEMHRTYSRKYLEDAKRVIQRGFLSINQEARGPQNQTEVQPPVHELISEVGGYLRATRFRHWLRGDYVDEYYTIVRTAQLTSH